MSSATREYRDAEDSFKMFLSECTEPEEGVVVLTRTLFDAYNDWGGKLGIRNFYAKMEEEGYKKIRPRSGEFRDKTIFEGLRLIGNE